MTIEQAITKAQEGGFDPPYWDRAEIGTRQLNWVERQALLLDPSFWQSLGKALGWESLFRVKGKVTKHVGISGKRIGSATGIASSTT